MEYIVFDTETNGLKDASVLSISAIRVRIEERKVLKIDRYDRYYFRNPGERSNPAALKVNNLYSDTIIKRRKDCNYPLYFTEDIGSFIEFCRGVKGFIAHNLSFDRSFLPFSLNSGYCTLSGARKIEGYTDKKHKLDHVADHYKIDIEAGRLHGSMYDTEVLYEIVKKMIENNDCDINSYIEETSGIEGFTGDDVRGEGIVYDEYAFTYNQKNYLIEIPRGDFDRSGIANQVKYATNQEVILNKNLLKKNLKGYQNPAPNYMYRDEAKSYIFNNIYDFAVGEAIDVVKEGRIEDIEVREGLVSLTKILFKINEYLPKESKLNSVVVNNYLANKGVLSKDVLKTVINNNSYNYGIILVQEMDGNTGELKEYIRYTDRGKRFVLDNIQWISGEKDELNKRFEDIVMTEKRPEYIIIQNSTPKPELVRKEIDIENLKESIKGASIVVTGKHEVYKRKDLQELIENSGGEFSKGINKVTSLLVIGDKAGSKLEKAEKMGIPVVEIDKFVSLVKA